jgi:phosphoribosylformylglycinamidine synthase
LLRSPTVGSKNFLVTIGDRSVGGLCARDQMVGPWQTPVADCAATAYGFRSVEGEAFAMGERPPIAVLDAPASGRMALGEALTNLAAAPVALDRVKLSANWMAAAGLEGEEAALFDTVRAVALDLCLRLGVSIPVGKDSLSMRTTWREAGASHDVVSPVSLIVSAFAPCADVRAVWTPALVHVPGGTELILLDLSGGRHRIGGSILAQVYGSTGEEPPDFDDAPLMGRFFALLRALRDEGRVLAYHDRSDGGLFAAACEMAFAGRAGLSLNVDLLAYDALSADVDGSERQPGTLGGRDEERVLRALFAEELGALIQVRAGDRAAVLATCREKGVPAHWVGSVADPAEPREDRRDMIRIVRNAKPILALPRAELQREWSRVSHALQRLRDNPDCADEEFADLAETGQPPLYAALSFDHREDVAAPFIGRGARPAVAILREQGVNGHMEMAAAFEAAGFEPLDVHMSDLIAGRADLASVAGLAACGGFSYGDVLGAGQGWAKSILLNARARESFARFFGRGDTFALGVCNGCQMMAHLSELIPGAQAWPRFERNRSEQFEARVVMVEVMPGPSLFFQGMAGSRLPVITAHGEGRAVFRSPADRAGAIVSLRYVDARGAAAERYPANPNGSPGGVTGLSTADGRFTILMPHPERMFRTVQCSWHPGDWGEYTPWIRMFRNARAALG